MRKQRLRRSVGKRNFAAKASSKSTPALRAEQLENRLLLSVNDLVWNGTSGADQVLFEQIDATTIRVTESLLNGAAVNNVTVYAGIDGRVIASGLGGNDLLDASGLTTTQSTLDGGAGSNTLRGGAAADLLIGGTNGGEGAQASHTISGGAGDDTIYGNAQVGAEGSRGGNHLILGGAGNDTIYGAYGSVEKSNSDPSNGGEGGQNLIVGGTGSDTIYASQTGDGAEGGHGSIQVAGDSTLGEAELSTVLSEWTSTRTLSEKLDNIEGVGSGPRNNGDNFLQVGVTLFSDHAADQLFSDTNGAANWLIDTAGDDASSRVKAADIHDDVQVGQAIWINPSGGFWDEAANWQDGYLPGPNDIAVLNAGSNTITFRSGAVTVQGIQAASPLKVTGGALTVASDWEMHQSLELTAGTLTVAGNLVMHNRLKLNRTLTSSGPNQYTVTPSNLYVAGNLQMHDTLIFNGGGLHNATLWMLDGAQIGVGVMRHGTISSFPPYDRMIQETSGTLDNVTIASDVGFGTTDAYLVHNLTFNYLYPYLTVVNGLTLNAKLTLGSSTGHGGLRFSDSPAQVLKGTGEVTFGAQTSTSGVNSLTGTFTIDPDIEIHGKWGRVSGRDLTDVVTNRGTISADVAGGTISVGTTGGFINQGTVQAAGGAITATFSAPNEGIVAANAGSTLTISGPYIQAATGTTRIEVAGTSPSQYGKVNVTGAATLAGLLQIVYAGGFAPATNDAFNVLGYASRTGTYDTIDGSSVTFTPAYGPTTLTVTAVVP